EARAHQVAALESDGVEIAAFEARVGEVAADEARLVEAAERECGALACRLADELAVLEGRLAQVGVREAAAGEAAALEPGADEAGAGEHGGFDRARAQRQIGKLALGPVDAGEGAALQPVARGGRLGQENRSQADWRETPSASPMRAQLTSRLRSASTTVCSWLPMPCSVRSIGFSRASSTSVGMLAMLNLSL